MANPCTEPTSARLYNLLTQKRQAALYNIPPMRLNLISPYPTHTQAQLNMRRKVEILKYANQNSQANGLTKSQRWAQIVSGSVSSISQSVAQALPVDLTCASDLLIPTLTSACDVPGPPMYLTYDPTVPLYNYTNNRTFAVGIDSDSSLWKIYTTNEISAVEKREVSFSSDIATSNENTLGVIIITDYIKTPQTTYSISTPIAIWCKGLYTGSEYNFTTKSCDTPRSQLPVTPIQIKITGVLLKVYYNYDLLSSTIIDAPYNLTPLQLDPNITSEQLFYAIQYVGMLKIPDFTLNTQPGNIYNIRLAFTYSYTDLNGNTYNFTNLTGFEAGVFCNLGIANTNVYVNPSSVNTAVLSSPNTNPPYTAGSFVNFNSILAAAMPRF